MDEEVTALSLPRLRPKVAKCYAGEGPCWALDYWLRRSMVCSPSSICQITSKAAELRSLSGAGHLTLVTVTWGV